MDDLKAFGAIGATAATAAAVLGSEIVVGATTTSVAASGIAGLLGFTTIVTLPVTLSVAGFVTAVGLTGWGLHKVIKG